MKLLILEDDYILASGMAADLRMLGVEVIGPFAWVTEARDRSDDADGAILDIRLHDENSFVLADHFTDAGKPFVFYTGYSEADLPLRYSNAIRFSKPTGASEMIDYFRRSGDSPRSTDARDAFEALPILRLAARRLLPDDEAADRLVEATLRKAIRLSIPAGTQRELDQWLVDLLVSEFEARGRTFAN
jgi:hypothetical protein